MNVITRVARELAEEVAQLIELSTQIEHGRFLPAEAFSHVKDAAASVARAREALTRSADATATAPLPGKRARRPR